MKFTYALRFQFAASNNEAEYEALIAGLRIAARIRVRNIQVSVDSKLVANQVLETYIAKEENMIKYLEKTKSLISGFNSFSIGQIPRSKNKKADALSKIASTSFAHLSKQVLVEILKEKSIQEKEVAAVVEEEGPTWMTLIIEYLRDETLPNDQKKASKLHIKARQYELLEGILYRRSFLKPWLRCVGPLQVDYVIWEIHEGSCSMHAGPRSVVAKAMRSEYYWPTMYRDAREIIRKWPGKVKFLIVAMDYFTKWIKAKAIATISGSQVKKFVWDNISNRLVERANRSLGKGIKACLGEGNKNWLEELPYVLWAHRTMIKSSNDDTPNDASHAVDGGKLGPKWEGPYEVTEALGDGAYKLRSTDGTILPRTWNITNLKKCVDIAKISRKRLKPGKHEHGNGRARKEPGKCYIKGQWSTQVNLQVKRHQNVLIGPNPLDVTHGQSKESTRGRDFYTQATHKRSTLAVTSRIATMAIRVS
ncbi:reverse transcriptase domain-containing protein [Tanacetum coccineum]